MKNENSRLILLLGIIGFLTNGDIYSAAPLIIDIASDLYISISTATLSVTAYMLAFGLFTIIIGPLGDRFGKSKIIIISSFGTALFSCLSLFAYNIELLIIIRFINGAFAAGIMPVSMAIIGESVNEKNRQKTIATLMGMMFLGGASATIIGGALSYISSWKTVYFAYGVSEFFAAIVLLKYLEKKPGTVHVLDYLNVYRESLSNKQLLPVLSIIVLTGFCVLGTFTFSGELLNQKSNLNLVQIGALLSVFGFAGIMGSKITARVRQAYGNYISIIAGILGSVSLLLLTNRGSMIIAVFSLFGFGLSFILIHSTMVATAQTIIPHLRGTIMALVSLSIFTGSSLGTLVNKEILASSQVSNIFRLGSMIFFITGIAGYFVLNYAQSKNVVFFSPSKTTHYNSNGQMPGT